MPNTNPSRRVGHHCAQVNLRIGGRDIVSKVIADTNCRTATTPTGPMTGNAREPTAAPVWAERALPSITDRAAHPVPNFATASVVGTRVCDVEDMEQVWARIRPPEKCIGALIYTLQL